jgi:hypothetical protein
MPSKGFLAIVLALGVLWLAAMWVAIEYIPTKVQPSVPRSILINEQ